MIDAAILILCLLAAMGAECIPLLLSLVAAAGVLTVWKEIRNRPGAANTKTVKGGNDCSPFHPQNTKN